MRTSAPVPGSRRPKTASWREINSLRLIGGVPRHKAPLDGQARLERLRGLLQLWANGCTCAVDEDLFADILNRYRP
ncbi:hypothetical protein [Roseibium salinum]|uniref:Uncharacterized protein n=1 Tax=Roseibium salinum TaxID=1604349 RepID=A0ABT3R486_9HYPH|nr:hypothetical protein [Roseibium sp. DSM 29163]MCX2723878.1 hypothetical protein [Roseibium sp. DSM 29163]